MGKTIARKGNTVRTNILIIGAGQAGLAAAYALKKHGLRFLIVDAGEEIGDSWRHRYDSLTLFTPRSMSALSNMPLDGDANGYAGKDEFADYLRRYASLHKLPVISSKKVIRLKKAGSLFTASTEDGDQLTSHTVIVAAGAFATPRIPAMAKLLPADIRQLHVAEFRNSSSVADGPVLVIGDGASGRDVAIAMASFQQVLLARGRNRILLPEKIFGGSLWLWLRQLGLLRASSQGIIGQRMRRADPFPARGNDNASLRRLGVILKPRLTAFHDHRARFEDGSNENIRSIVWATGYADVFPWIDVEGAVDSGDAPIQSNGISPVAGLYYVGRPWQRNRASGLIAGVADDAEFIVQHIRQRCLESI